MSETPERRFKVLIVEDDVQILRVLRLELEHEGYLVDTASDGLSGLEKALKEPDLVILDVMLPKMDGLEVCTRVRAKSRVPIVMLTTRAEPAERARGAQVGASDYIVKPFDTDDLLRRVQDALSNPAPRLS